MSIQNNKISFYKLMRKANLFLLVNILVFSLVGCTTVNPSSNNNIKKLVVLQLTDNSPQKQTLVLNVADNLVRKYGNNIDLEIVAFGPGLQLMFAKNKNSIRITKLSKSGVRFTACRNTTKKLHKALGKDQVEFHKHVNETEFAGAARIIELVEKGYVLIRP